MCGITGLMSRDEVQEAEMRSMTHCLSHRGPDSVRTLVSANGHVGLGHTRLSVIDLSAEANQPMTSADRRYSIVFNGEIYNYKSLRTELLNLNRGIVFNTNSDTEVILQGFIHWGTEICKKLDGMFAFAIYDDQCDRLFLCRDRIGKKPLFYFLDDRVFAFASEIKALLKHSWIHRNRNIDYGVMYTFLHLGYVPEAKTPYVSIHKLPAGHFAFVKRGAEMEIGSFIARPEEAGRIRSGKKADLIAELKRRLVSAVQKRLMSDVPVGTFLSGGTDSSLITAIAAKMTCASPLKTFSIGFVNSPFDEMGYAREVAKTLKTDHYEHRLTEHEALGFLEAYLTHFDEPFADTSAIPTMLVSKLAKQHVSVALTGDGADELFLGYGAYDWASRLNGEWTLLFQYPLASLLKRFGDNRLKRIGFMLQPVKRSEIRSHIFSQEQYLFSRNEIGSMATRVHDDFKSLVYRDPTSARLTPAEKQAIYDLNNYLKDDLLVKVDRASMYFGLECRCPFLDADVIALAHRLPYRMKRTRQERKWILKEILKEYLPEELVYRPKWGFSIPLAKWMKGELAYLIEKYLCESMVLDVNIVNYKHIKKLKESFFKGDDFLYNRLWVLIVAHKWLHENAR